MCEKLTENIVDSKNVVGLCFIVVCRKYQLYAGGKCERTFSF